MSENAQPLTVDEKVELMLVAAMEARIESPRDRAAPKFQDKRESLDALIEHFGIGRGKTGANRLFLVLVVLVITVLSLSVASLVQSYRSRQLEERVSQLLSLLTESPRPAPTGSASVPDVPAERAEPVQPPHGVPNHAPTGASRR